MIASSNDLFNWREIADVSDTVEPWKPVALGHGQWPPNYRAVYAWRMKTLNQLRDDPKMLAEAKRWYAKRPATFIMHWMDTYDPRRKGVKWIPFILFMKQLTFIEFLQSCSADGENGLVEKCRDMGITWEACAYSVHSWLFIPNDAIGWGSRKQDLVDNIGDPDSIFEKMRLLIRRLPDVFKPSGLSPAKHLTFMQFLNPENGSTITGEAGDNIGRGGRKRIYFKDESAHYERPEKIEAALGDNTNCQIDISSVNGLGNVFHRKREAGVDWPMREKGFTRVLVVDWRDHPGKTQEWYNTRKARYEREGMLHIFAQEVDRNYSAAVLNTLIPYEWIEASVDAHIHVPYLAAMDIPDVWSAGMDVADEGVDKNALTTRQWIIWRNVEQWSARDPGVSARKAIDMARRIKRGIKVQYDSIGMGTNVKSEFNRLIEEKIITTAEIKMVGWNAGAGVQRPFDRIIPEDVDSPLNKDFFHNLKAQAWWSIRTRFYKTFMAVTKGVVYRAEELISLDSKMPLLQTLMKELAQPTRGQSGSLKTIIEKQPDGMKSPDLADSGVMAFFPMIDDYGTVITGTYGT